MERLFKCACGCGSDLPVGGVGRSRKYLNNTHKSRANNQRTRELTRQGFAIKEAVLLRHILGMEDEDILLWYPEMTGEQWSVIQALRSSHYGYDKFIETLSEMAGW